LVTTYSAVLIDYQLNYLPDEITLKKILIENLKSYQTIFVSLKSVDK